MFYVTDAEFLFQLNDGNLNGAKAQPGAHVRPSVSNEQKPPRYAHFCVSVEVKLHGMRKTTAVTSGTTA